MLPQTHSSKADSAKPRSLFCTVSRIKRSFHKLAGSKLVRAFLLCGIVAAAFALMSWQTSNHNTVSGQATATCPQVSVPALTHGFVLSPPRLPDGDHFLLPQPFNFALPTVVAGTTIFNANPSAFGGNIDVVGGFAGTTPQGVSFSSPSSSFTMLSCTDSVWDFSFLVASSGATVGDTLRFFAQNASGTTTLNILTLTVEANGVRVTAINAFVFVFLNDRLGNVGRLAVGDFVPFVAAAGGAGSRTSLLTVAYQMRPDSPFNACLQLGLTINRASGQGATSVLITDVIVKRMEVAGDRARTDRGLIGGLTGGYPTGLVCDVICPLCPPVKCDTICFRSADYWLLHLKAAPGGLIFVSGQNFGQGISTNNLEALKFLLQGGASRIFGGLSLQGFFNQQFVTAQLNLLLSTGGGSPTFFNVQWANLSCYGLTFTPVTLSNGVVLSSNSMVKELFMQAYLAAVQNRSQDFLALANVFLLLNGTDPSNVCQ